MSRDLYNSVVRYKFCGTNTLAYFDLLSVKKRKDFITFSENSCCPEQIKFIVKLLFTNIYNYDFFTKEYKQRRLSKLLKVPCLKYFSYGKIIEKFSYIFTMFRILKLHFVTS